MFGNNKNQPDYARIADRQDAKLQRSWVKLDNLRRQMHWQSDALLAAVDQLKDDTDKKIVKLLEHDAQSAIGRIRTLGLLEKAADVMELLSGKIEAVSDGVVKVQTASLTNDEVIVDSISNLLELLINKGIVTGDEVQDAMGYGIRLVGVTRAEEGEEVTDEQANFNPTAHVVRKGDPLRNDEVPSEVREAIEKFLGGPIPEGTEIRYVGGEVLEDETPDGPTSTFTLNGSGPYRHDA